MTGRSDFAQQTQAVNVIEDNLISEYSRVVCYNQSIYDDLRLELNEYAGLTLGIRDSTVLTLVKPVYDQASILILDNDRKLTFPPSNIYFIPFCQTRSCDWPGADFFHCFRGHWCC